MRPCLKKNGNNNYIHKMDLRKKKPVLKKKKRERKGEGGREGGRERRVKYIYLNMW